MSAASLAAGAPPSKLEREIRTERERPLPKDLFQDGTGFFASNGELVLTSAHVVSACRQFKLRGSDGHEQTASLIFWDGIHDIAILRPDKRGTGGLALSGPLAGASEPSLRVFLYQFGLGSSDKPADRAVTALSREIRMGASDMVTLDAALDTGASGSPVLDGNSGVIGMITARIDPEKGVPGRPVTLAISSDDLAKAVRYAGGDPESRIAGLHGDARALMLRVHCR